MLWTLSCAASNRSLDHEQHTMQDPSIEKVTPFWSYELLLNFLIRKQPYLSFLLTKRKDAHMRPVAPLLDQDKATQAAELWVPDGGCCGCLCYMELAEVTLQPAGMHSMSLEASLRLQHRHGLVQVISNVDDRCLSVQGSGSLQCSVLAWHNENIFHYKDGQTLKQIPWGVWGISVLEDF